MNDPRKSDDRIHTGFSWYPEAWPESEWPADIARMREVGITMVRLFEFAWRRLEPSEGVFDFGWARSILDQLHAAGIRVMLGTPTAAPPSWLTTRYPEVLGTGSDGRRKTHGMRKHFNHHSPLYRVYCQRIVEAMARELGAHPAVHAWQIDNEMSGDDFGPETRSLFHRWLETWYGSIEALNQAWGLAIWSQAYDRFDDVPLAAVVTGGSEILERHHPSLLMAMARFQNEGWTTYISEQCACIRRFCPQPITTNMVGGLGGMFWFQHNQALDRVGYSMYHDVEHYPWLLWKFDRMRAEKQAPYWLLETAPNWSGGGQVWNIHHDAAGVQAMTWLSIAHGGTMTLFWQWREHWAGQEVQHGTLVTATGKWRPNRDAMAGLISDISKAEKWLLANPPMKAQVGLLVDNEAGCALSIDPLEGKFIYESRWRDAIHLALVEKHIWRDVLSIHADFSPYRALILPWVPILPEDVRRRLHGFVESGGLLILGPLCGYRTYEFTVFTDHEFGGLEELIGAECTVRFPPSWMEERLEIRFNDGTVARTRQWCDGFTPRGARAVAHYHYTTPGGYGDGAVAVLANTFGKGRVVTLGCPLDPDSWIRLVQGELTAAGIVPVAEGSSKVAVVPRGVGDIRSGWCVVNMAETPQTLRLETDGIDLLTGNTTGRDIPLRPLQAMVISTDLEHVGRCV